MFESKGALGDRFAPPPTMQNQKHAEDITLSNWIDFYLDVLATSPDELQQVQTAFQEPSTKLLAWEAGRRCQRVEDIAAGVKDLVSFKPAQNIASGDPTKTRRFINTFKETFWGLVKSHIHFVSERFPNAIFLLEYWNLQASSAGKLVIRVGDEIRCLHDGNQQAQGYAWALPDIFAPYRAEHDNGQQFGSLQNRWIEDMGSALEDLRKQSSVSSDASSQ
jgi:hypothetical protein